MTGVRDHSGEATEMVKYNKSTELPRKIRQLCRERRLNEDVKAGESTGI